MVKKAVKNEFNCQKSECWGVRKSEKSASRKVVVKIVTAGFPPSGLLTSAFSFPTSAYICAHDKRDSQKKISPRVLNGHPWIFGNEVNLIDGDAKAGDVVEVLTHDKNSLARDISTPNLKYLYGY